MKSRALLWGGETEGRTEERRTEGRKDGRKKEGIMKKEEGIVKKAEGRRKVTGTVIVIVIRSYSFILNKY